MYLHTVSLTETAVCVQTQAGDELRAQLREKEGQLESETRRNAHRSGTCFLKCGFYGCCCLLVV